MPRAHDYLTYRIIDVSSFHGMIRRWAPKMESKFMHRLSSNGHESVSHRAMDDIEWSIEFMKLFQPLFDQNTNRLLYTKDRRYRRKKSDESHLHVIEKRFEKKIDVKKLNLDVPSEQIYKSNPHLREIFIDNKTCVIYNGIFQKKNSFLHLSFHAPVREIFPTENITTQHWGQRKLLVTEIEFLTQFARNGEYLVIYIGFSQGLYINYLADLFPNVDFVLIGPKQITGQKTSRIQIQSEESIDDWIKFYSKSDKNLLLICDIHTFGTRKNTDECIQRDHENQISWHLELKPIASLLTFRLSRNQLTTEFLQGDIVLSPWSSRRTNDYRLVTLQYAEVTTYDNKRMLSALSYFQNVLRTQYYEHNIDDSNSEGLDHCYDCRAEIYILSQYLTKIRDISGTTILEKAILQMSHDLSTSLHDKN